LILGSEHGSTAKVLRRSDDKPDFTEHSRWPADDRWIWFRAVHEQYTEKQGRKRSDRAIRNARQTRVEGGSDNISVAATGTEGPKLSLRYPKSLRRTRSRPRRWNGRRWRSETVTDRTRMIANPYPKTAGGARHRSNQGARRAGDSGVGGPPDRGARETSGVYCAGMRSDRAGTLLEPRRRQYRLLRQTGCGEALRGRATFGIASDEFGLYKLFPVPVFAGCDDFGLTADDPRGLTAHRRTAYSEAPGNSYSLHEYRGDRGRPCATRPGFVGHRRRQWRVMSKYSVGVYSTDPASGRRP